MLRLRAATLSVTNLFSSLKINESSSQSIRTLSTCFNRANSKLNTQKNNVNYQQVAYYRGKYSFPLNWVNRRGGGFDENLSAENQTFLDKVVEDQFTNTDSPLREAPWKRGEFDPNSVNKRIGLIGIKLGSVPQWTKDGRKIYTTLLQVLDNHVIDYVPPEALLEKSNALNNFKERSKEGQFGMALVGAISSDPRLYTPQYLELFKNSGVPPKRKLTKFMVSPNAVVQPGTPLHSAHFKVGDYVDVGANTIAFGFQGTMKRWGFKGGPRSHGATKFHRKRGSIGSGRDRRPIKGTKMAGRMGGRWREQKGLKIWRINHKYNILYIHGPTIPGPTHSYVRIVDSCLPMHRELVTKENHPPFPTFYLEEGKLLPDEEFDKDLHGMSEPTLKFESFEVKKVSKREGAKLAKIKN